MWRVAIFLSCVGTALCRPPIQTTFGNFSTDPLSQEDYEWLAKHTPTKRLTYPSSFKFMYVSQDGHIVENHRPSTGNYVEVIGSTQVPHSALYLATFEVGKILRHAPSHIFNNIAQRSGAGLGVFTAQEKITIFPEFYSLRDTASCHGRCDGSCSHTCTFDGRKYESIAGVTNTRSVVVIDNVLCNSRDPYHHHDNILVHEFAHTVERYGLDSSEKSQVTNAYNHARSNNLWRSGSYAMANHAEYFAEGTGAFFLVNLQSTTGGMTDCPGHKCSTETEVRQFLHDNDIQLWTVLSHVYTNGHSSTPSDIKICDSASGSGTGTGGSTGSTDCQDDVSSCASWASGGECDRNPGYMLEYCKRSCASCGGASSIACSDSNSQCPKWGGEGECESNPGYMLANCKHTCGTCGGAPSIACSDSDSRCPTWGGAGECVTNPGYMLSHCKHTCGTCGQDLVGR